MCQLTHPLAAVGTMSWREAVLFAPMTAAFSGLHVPD
jgi:hypothetical protein